MPGFETQVAHNLGRDEARRRLQDVIGQIRRDYSDQVSDVQESWDDNVLTFALKAYGFKVSGTLTVDDDRAVVEGQLPLLALPFRGQVQDFLAAEMTRSLA